MSALDDLYAEGTTMPRYPSERDERPRPTPRPKHCRACGGVGGHTSVECPGWED
jgi:hypothetical protein